MSSGNTGTIAYALIQVCKVPLFLDELEKQIEGNLLFYLDTFSYL